MVSLTAWNKKDIKSIIDSGKFDSEFYLEENPDVKKSGLDRSTIAASKVA